MAKSRAAKRGDGAHKWQGGMHQPQAEVQSSNSQEVVMPIETQLMHLTPEMIQDLSAEMTNPAHEIGKAIAFIRSHPNQGWTKCADYNETCICEGQVRLGSYAGNWPSFSAARNVSGAVVCDKLNFEAMDAVNNASHCQCFDALEESVQDSGLRFNSISYLQEAWISITRVLAQAKLLPMNGDRGFQGSKLFDTRGAGTMGRLYLDKFLEESGHFLPQNPSTCIEWGPMSYLPRFPACANGRKLVLQYQSNLSKMYTDKEDNVHCDNVHLGQCLGEDTKIDIAIATNVWEHEKDPFDAIESLYGIMRFGGMVLFTVPFAAPYHGVPYDFYRYTKLGVVHILEKAGFCVPRTKMASGGDFVSDIALYAGVGPGDFSALEIDETYKRGFNSIPDGPLIVMAMAYKNATAADCSQLEAKKLQAA